MLSQNVRDALQAEMEHLKIRRKRLTERIDARIDAIESVLRPEEEDIAIPVRSRQAGEPRSTGRLEGLGLRGAMRAVLSERPNSTSSEVASHMAEGGFVVGGETSLGIRVGNELTRMWKVGLLEKNGNRFSLKGTSPGFLSGAA